MPKRSTIPEDPVVREVRAIRQALWKKGGGTVAGLLRAIEEFAPPLKRRKRRLRRHRVRS